MSKDPTTSKQAVIQASPPSRSNIIHVIEHQDLRSHQIAVGNIQLKSCGFYFGVSDLARPTRLDGGPLNKSSIRGQQVSIFHFTLDEKNLAFFSGSQVPCPYRVYIRFFEAWASGEQSEYISPCICSVIFNSSAAQLPDVLQVKCGFKSAQRKCEPVDITALCCPLKAEVNTVEVTWRSNANRNVCMFIQLVCRVTASGLLKRLTQNDVREAQLMQEQIKENLMLGSDSDIVATNLRISLCCPLGAMRMSAPCRANTCTHLQCFDALVYFQMNEQRPSWNCPICDKSARYENLFIDGFFMEIIEKSRGANLVELGRDGEWSPVDSLDDEDEDEDSGDKKPDELNNMNNFAYLNAVTTRADD